MFSSKSNTTRAVDDVSFYLQQGEVFVLAGESGSGKSTIAKIILKSIELDSGKIFLTVMKLTMNQIVSKKLE